MKKLKVLGGLQECGVVAVIRAESGEEAYNMAVACVDGGLTNLEVTFTTPDAQEVIRRLVAQYGDRALVGAGTVLDPVTARIAMLAGAEFVVSPSFDQETAQLCNLYGIPYMPGVLTLSEIKEALKHGADVLKLFPGSAYGPGFVKAVKGPMPHVNIMPTGGVDLDNMEQWLKAGCLAVGIGGNLTAPAKEGRYDQITELAAAYVARFKACSIASSK